MRFHSLHITSLLFFFITGCVFAEYTCKHETFAGDETTPLPQVKSVSSGQTSKAAFRILLSTMDLESDSRYCNKVNAVRSTFYGGTSTCSRDDILTEEKALLVPQLLQAAVKLHTDRLKVKRISGLLILPKFTTRGCKEFLIPESHMSKGVPDADFVLYVAAGAGQGFALSCAELSESGSTPGRPVAGVLKIMPAAITSSRLSVRILAHDMAHALGFSYHRMKAHKIVEDASGVRQKTNPVKVVNSRKTVEATRKQYGCKSRIIGMELEDELSEYKVSPSHWKRRNAKDELMSAIVSETSAYTMLTMSLFADMGYYDIVPGKAETMIWGSDSRGTDCVFLRKKCFDNDVELAPPGMFCRENIQDDRYRCTFNRLSLGECPMDVKDMNTFSPAYHYFANGALNSAGHADLVDGCPIIKPLKDHNCFDGTQKKYHYSGDDSRCLEGIEDSESMDNEEDPITGKGLEDHINEQSPRGLCVKVICYDDNRYSIHFDEELAPKMCTPGQTVRTEKGFFGGAGTIKCPKFEEVCLFNPSAIDNRPPLRHRYPGEDTSVSENSAENEGTRSTKSKNRTSHLPVGDSTSIIITPKLLIMWVLLHAVVVCVCEG